MLAIAPGSGVGDDDAIEWPVLPTETSEPYPHDHYVSAPPRATTSSTPKSSDKRSWPRGSQTGPSTDKILIVKNITELPLRTSASAMTARAFCLLCSLCCMSTYAMKLAPRRALLGGAAALVAPAAALADEELSWAEKAKAEGRARAAARKAESDKFNAKLATLGGVEGQVVTPGGTSVVEKSSVGDLNPIKMKRAMDRKGEGLEEPGIALDLPQIKFQMKRAPGSDGDGGGPALVKLKR